MSTWDKIITDSNKITDLTAPTSAFSMNSQILENVQALESTASTDLTLEHGADKDIVIKENGTIAATFGSVGGITAGTYGYKIFANGDESEDLVTSLTVNNSTGTTITAADMGGAFLNNLTWTVHGNMLVDCTNNVTLDSAVGNIFLKTSGGEYTPTDDAHATT